MAGRPRTITDERLLDAVGTAIGRVGPARLTLADVAREAGVTTGALVQRFGSKRGLLLAFARQGTDEFVAAMREVYDRAPDPVEGLVSVLTALVGEEMSPNEFAHHLAYLNMEMADDELRPPLVAGRARFREALAEYIADGIGAGLLRVPDTAALVEVLDALWHGTQISWALFRDGTRADLMRATVATVLAPYRVVN
jgi:AcrR family transcriptional regulator